MKKLNSKGFTLIELLAVVVIMGILMIVAIPAVTKYINNSKKDVFIDNASAYINSARYSLLNNEYSCVAPVEDNAVVNIPLDIIDIDKGNGMSVYNSAYGADCYVQATYTGGKLEFSICLVDQQGNGTFISDATAPKNLVAESKLERKNISIKGAGTCTKPASLCSKKTS